MSKQTYETDVINQSLNFLIKISERKDCHSLFCDEKFLAMLTPLTRSDTNLKYFIKLLRNLLAIEEVKVFPPFLIQRCITSREDFKKKFSALATKPRMGTLAYDYAEELKELKEIIES